MVEQVQFGINLYLGKKVCYYHTLRYDSMILVNCINKEYFTRFNQRIAVLFLIIPLLNWLTFQNEGQLKQ